LEDVHINIWVKSEFSESIKKEILRKLEEIKSSLLQT